MERQITQAKTLALNKQHYERLVDDGLNRVLNSWQRRVSNDFVDSMISKANRGIEGSIPFDPLRRKAMVLQNLGAVRAHVTKLADAAKSNWYEDEKLPMRKHLNRAAFYAQDQTGFLFGAAQKEIAFVNGARRYKWLRTSSANPRDVHLNRVGKIYHFGELPDEPGVLPNCKCSLEPIYD